MTSLLLTALLCQWPLPETPEPLTVAVYEVETIELNTDEDGRQQFVFWEMPREAGGKIFETFRGRVRLGNRLAVINARDGDWVYEDDLVEVHAKRFVTTYGFESVAVTRRLCWVRMNSMPELLWRW